MYIVGIIPAREGSKRIPKKNIKILNGKPLITYTINSAKKSKLLSSFYVSTDDKKIKQISESYGSPVINRPKILARDTTQSIVSIQHAIKNIENFLKITIDVVVILQPTSPLRSFNDIDNAIQKFLKKKCQSLVSVTNVCFPPEFMFRIKKGKLNNILKTKIKSKRTQDMPKTFQINGAIYIATRKLIMEKNTVLSKTPYPYFMPIERSIDVDTLLDFKFTEFLLKNS